MQKCPIFPQNLVMNVLLSHEQLSKNTFNIFQQNFVTGRSGCKGFRSFFSVCLIHTFNNNTFTHSTIQHIHPLSTIAAWPCFSQMTYVVFEKNTSLWECSICSRFLESWALKWCIFRNNYDGDPLVNKLHFIFPIIPWVTPFKCCYIGPMQGKLIKQVLMITISNNSHSWFRKTF